MAPKTLYRSFDGLDWYSLEDAQKWEKRLNAVKRSLDQIGGVHGLCELTQRSPNRNGGFLNLYTFPIDQEGGKELAESLEELVALGNWAQKVLDEVGDCPIHHKFEPGPM